MDQEQTVVFSSCSISKKEKRELYKVLLLVMGVLVPRSERLLAKAGVEYGPFTGLCDTFGVGTEVESFFLSMYTMNNFIALDKRKW